MLVDLLLFPLYVFLVLIIGLGFFRGINFFLKLHSPHVSPGVALLFGQFCIGLVALVANFFVGVTHPGIYLVIIIFFFFGLAPLRRYSPEEHCFCMIFSFALAPLAAFMAPGYDAGLYHLPHQLWIREEKIVFGLANFHGRFGFSSFQEYISAVQWVGEHLKLVVYSNVLYVLSFLLFVQSWVRSRHNDASFLSFLAILSVLLIYVLDKKNQLFLWEYCYIDIQAGLLFFITFMYGFKIICDYSRKNLIEKDLFIFFFFVTYVYFMKLSTSIIIIWMLLIVIFLLSKKIISIKKMIVLNIFNAVYFLIWIAKNIITTGCILYPLTASCLPVSWSAQATAQDDSEWIIAWARHPKSGLYSLDDWSWFGDWWIREYGSLLLGMLVVLAAFSVLAVTVNVMKTKHFFVNWRHLAGFLFLAGSLAFWFFNAPAPRFALGLFLALPPALAFVFVSEAVKHSMGTPCTQRLALSALLILALVLGGWNIGTFSIIKVSAFDPVSAPQPEIVATPPFGFHPVGTDQCWLVPHCSPYPRTAPVEKMGYLVFRPVQNRP